MSYQLYYPIQDLCWLHFTSHVAWRRRWLVLWRLHQCWLCIYLKRLNVICVGVQEHRFVSLFIRMPIVIYSWIVGMNGCFFFRYSYDNFDMIRLSSFGVYWDILMIILTELGYGSVLDSSYKFVTRVNILDKIPYFFSPPNDGNILIPSLFFGEKIWSNVKVCS